MRGGRGEENEERGVWFFHGGASGPSLLQNPPPLLGWSWRELCGRRKKRPCPTSSKLRRWFWRGDSRPEFGGVEEHSHSSGEGNAYNNVKYNNVESDSGDLGDGTGIKHLYWDDIWNQEHFTYDLKPHSFVEASGPNVFWNKFPTMMQLFGLFWSFNILQDIVNETDWYATSYISNGVIPGGDHWILFTVAEFKAWFAIWLYMGMNQRSNMKSYWMKEGLVFQLSYNFWNDGTRLFGGGAFTAPHFLKHAPILGSVKSSICHEDWRFHFFSNFIFS